MAATNLMQTPKSNGQILGSCLAAITVVLSLPFVGMTATPSKYTQGFGGSILIWFITAAGTAGASLVAIALLPSSRTITVATRFTVTLLVTAFLYGIGLWLGMKWVVYSNPMGLRGNE